MSSGSEYVGIGVAAVLAAPVAAAMGVGWAAWKAGSMIAEANRAMDAEIARQKKEAQEATRARFNVAMAGRNQLLSVIDSAISELQKTKKGVSGKEAQDIDALISKLQATRNEGIPENVGDFEAANVSLFEKVNTLLRAQKVLSGLKIVDEHTKQTISSANFMENLRVAFMAANVKATSGKNITAQDPFVLERAELNKELMELIDQVLIEIEFIEKFAQDYGLSDANNAWFQSIFNGVDVQIEALCNPMTPNNELKKGMKRLKEMMEQYEMLAPNIRRDKALLDIMYPAYVTACKALAEPVHRMGHFKTVAALEAEMNRLLEREKRAEECAKIYQQLGPSAYICYAMDEELRAMGYSVHSRKQITEMTSVKPEYATQGEMKLPFYQWEENMTQLYSVSPDCDLQLIVHEDGVVSMQTIAKSKDDETTKQTQKHHCARLQELRRKMAENWFVNYDFQENASAEEILYFETWMCEQDNAWTSKNDSQIVTDQRTAKQETTQQMTMK